jgi:hypothetical protein
VEVAVTKGDIQDLDTKAVVEGLVDLVEVTKNVQPQRTL